MTVILAYRALRLTPNQMMERIEKHMRAWGVVAEDTLATPSSFIVFGSRNRYPG